MSTAWFDSSSRRLSFFACAAKTAVVAAFGAASRRFNPRGAIAFTIGAGLSVAIASAPFSATAEDGRPDDAFVLVAFGDSLTAGYGLPVEEGFAPQLEAWLRANGAPDAIVINAGVSGDTTSDGLARLDWSIGSEADAVLLELGANDALRGVDPAIAKSNLDKMLARLGERGLPVLLAGMMAPRNWGDEYIDAFEPMYAELAQKHGVLLYPFFLDGLTTRDEDALAEDYFQDDRLHPNAKGVKKLVETIGPSVLELIKSARQ